MNESEEKFRKISDAANDAIVMAYNNGNITYWNRAAEGMFGYTSEEVAGHKLHQTIIHDKFQKAHLKGFNKFCDTGQGAVIGKTIELEAIRKDRIGFPIELSLSGVRIKEKWCAIGIIRDITERKKAEEQIRKLSRAVEQSPSTIVITDTEGNIEYVNPKFCHLTGYSSEEAIGKNPRILSPVGNPIPYTERCWNPFLQEMYGEGNFVTKRKMVNSIRDL